MREQKNSYKYFYNGKEVDKGQFEKLAVDDFRWFEGNSIVSFPFSSFDNFFNGRFKSNKQVNERVKSLLGIDRELPTYKNIEKSGEKHNKGKLPMSKLFTQFPDALQAVVLASCYGHNKYKETDVTWLNFKKVPGGSQAFKDACLRHSLGAEKDEESGLPEIFHQAWNKLAELQLWLEENNINIKKFSKEYLDNLK